MFDDSDWELTLECGFVGENLTREEDIAQISVKCRTSFCGTNDGINEKNNSEECPLKRIINQGLPVKMDLNNARMPTQARLSNEVYDLIEEKDVRGLDMPAQIEVTNLQRGSSPSC